MGMETKFSIVEERELLEDALMIFEEKHAAGTQAVSDLLSMSPPLSPSPILSPNTPSGEFLKSFRFRFNNGTSFDAEAPTIEASDNLKDEFLTMNARVKSPGPSDAKTIRSENEARMNDCSLDTSEENVPVWPKNIVEQQKTVDNISVENGSIDQESTENGRPVESLKFESSFGTGEDVQDQEQSDVPSVGTSQEARQENLVTVDKHSVVVVDDGEGSIVDLDIEKLALEIEAHNRAMSTAVMSRFVEVKKKLVQHEQDAVELARMQHQKELSRIHDDMTRLREEHDAAVKRAHDMVDMANRAAELVALRSQQTRNTAVTCGVLWRWKEETNWQRYLKRMERKANQQYEQHSLQRKPLRKWRELAKTGKQHMLEFKTKMFLKDEKERLASESAGEVQRLRQEAANLRDELAGEVKAKEKLQEDMKRAFMRGVCALNIEALAMMKRGEMQTFPDSPNAVVTGAPVVKEHVQYYEGTEGNEGQTTQDREPSAAGFYSSTSPGAVRASKHENAGLSRGVTYADSLAHPESPSQNEPASEGGREQTDTTVPEQRIISEHLKMKLAAVMADGMGVSNGIIAGGISEVRPSFKSAASKGGVVVDVRPQSDGAGVVVRRSSMKQTPSHRGTEAQTGWKTSVRSGSEPRWN